MGFIGQEIGNEVGGLIGGYVGNKFKHKKTGQKIGALVGKFGVSYLPFENGGIVKPPKGHMKQIIVAHKGELIVPKHMVKHVSKSLKNKIKRNGWHNMI